MNDFFYALAIDPSLNDTGLCVAKITPQRNKHKIEIVEVSNIPNGHFPANWFGHKHNHIERRLYQIRDTYRPSIVAKEGLAVRNISQAEKLAPVHAIVHMVFGDDVIEYSPTNIKKVCANDGNAEKQDIMQSIHVHLLEKTIETKLDLTNFYLDDHSDAIAIMYTLLVDKGYIVPK
jgi:Holliday junction resolvasome RuvABC endonuclease subunit